MKNWQVSYAVYIEVPAKDKYQARERAQDQLREGCLGLPDVMDIDDDPLTVVELDDHGDPVS